MLGIAQMTSTGCVKANLATVRSLVQQGVSKGAALMAFPEAFDYVGVPGTSESFEKASLLTDALMQEYCAVAKANQVWLSLGGFHERLEGDVGKRKIANTHCIIDSSGEIRTTYRKIHLFDVDYDGGYKESNGTVSGDVLRLVDTPVGRIGITICYDLRFPLMFNRLAAAGADVILVPSAFMPTTGAAHWHTLLRSRAIENQCYVAAPAQTGAHNAKRSSYGHSIAFDPWGDVLFDLGQETNQVGMFSVNKEEIQSVRRKMPMQNAPDIAAFPLEIV